MNGSSQRRLRYAAEQMERGQVQAAIETLADLLGQHPDDADAHALLALCLVRRKRLHAARLEAETSLRLEPDSPFAHRAMAAVLMASRRFADAERHLQEAGAEAPESAQVERDLAQLYQWWGRGRDAEAHAERALGLDPDSAESRVLLAGLALDRGDRAAAAALAREALAIDAESVDALVLAGRCALAEGRVDEAREHAVWALQQDPEDEAALTLLCAIKARTSLWMGLWWRFQAFVTAGGGGRSIAILLGLFLLVRVGAILLEDAGRADAAASLQLVWLGFCVYTWVAPGLFQRTVRAELQQVKLRPGF